jgi:hypothetical protein
MYYFGCVHRPGHYFFDINLTTIWEDNNLIPWKEIDGKLAPHKEGCTEKYHCKCMSSEEGISTIHHKDGWTALSFWDRSVDERPASNSAFFAEGTFTFEKMLELAKTNFPDIVGRFNFEIKLK